MGVASVFMTHYLVVWCQRIGMVEIYPYAGMDYCGDPDILALVEELLMVKNTQKS